MIKRLSKILPFEREKCNFSVNSSFGIEMGEGEFLTGYFFELDFIDTECLDIEYFKSNENLEEEDKIRYSLTFEKQTPQEAVDAGAEQTIFGYTFQCVADRYGTVDVDAIKIQNVNVDNVFDGPNVDVVKRKQLSFLHFLPLL